MYKLLVGLGNPGPEYHDTRHNAGAWWLEAAAHALKATLHPERNFFGRAARAQVGAHTLWLLEPSTFMNRSGHAVAALARFYKI